MTHSGGTGTRPLRFGKPRPLGDDFVSKQLLSPDALLPLLITPAIDGVELDQWAAAHIAEIGDLLWKHGGILFRGFGVREPETLARFVRTISAGPLEYRERSSPRTHVSDSIYTSTEHPPDQEIFLHNEQSYNLVFPSKIVFACAIEAADGGATPIADVREVYKRIDVTIRARFEELGYMYVRNFGTGLGLTWQEVFQTTDRPEVDRYCRANAIDVEWRGRDRLRTRQVRRVSGKHPGSDEAVWCNHATFFHHTTLDERVHDALARVFDGMDELPNNTFYGDGSPIELSVMDSLRQAYRDCTVVFPWHVGDLLLLDNMLTAHARQRFTGPRKILTAMADPWRWSDIARADR